MNKSRREEILLKYYAVIGSFVGVMMMGVGICMSIFSLDFNFPNHDSAPWGFVLIGVMLIIIAIAPWVDSKEKTKRQIIEEKDERNIAIFHQSCFYAYNVCLGIGVLALLFLAMLGYMNTVSFFTMASVFILAWILQILSRWYLNKKM